MLCDQPTQHNLTPQRTRWTHIGSLDQLVQHIARRFPIHRPILESLFANLDPAVLALRMRSVGTMTCFGIQGQLAIAARVEWNRRPPGSSKQLDALYGVGVGERQSGYRGDEDTLVVYGRSGF